MEFIAFIFGMLFIIGQVAGQAYFVALGIKASKVNHIVLKIIIGIFIVIFLSSPGLIMSILNPATCVPREEPLILTLFFVFWSLGISVLGCA